MNIDSSLDINIHYVILILITFVHNPRYDEDDYDSFTPKDPWATLASSHSPQRGSSPNASPPVSRHQYYGKTFTPSKIHLEKSSCYCNVFSSYHD